MFWDRKELMPFEHIGSNSVASFISKDNTPDLESVEHVLQGCSPAEKMGFLQLHLVLTRVLIWGQ